MTNLSHDDEYTVNDLVLVCTVFSFLGSCFIIGTFFYFKSLQKFAFRLIVNVAISDLFYEVSFWFTNPDTEGHACSFSGWLQQFGTMSSILWVTLITYVIHEVVCNPSQVGFAEKMWQYQIGIWGFSFVTAFFPLFSGSYGQASGWCWIEADNDWDIVWRFFIFYGPLIVVVIFISYMYYQTMLHIGDNNTIVRRMRLYPAILLLSFFFGLINRLVEVGGSHSFELACIHAFFMGLYGFMNCLAYIYTPQVRKTVFGWSTASDTLPTINSAEDGSKRSTTEIEHSFTDDYLSGSGSNNKITDTNMTMTYSDMPEDRMESDMQVIYAKETSEIDVLPNQYGDGAIEVIQSGEIQPDFDLEKAAAVTPSNVPSNSSAKV